MTLTNAVVIQALAKMFREHIPGVWLKEVTGEEGQVSAGSTFLIKERELGHGAYGTVWAATNLNGRQVAVKEQVINISEGINRVRSKLNRFAKLRFFSPYQIQVASYFYFIGSCQN
jgi:hypothetical protein